MDNKTEQPKEEVIDYKSMNLDTNYTGPETKNDRANKPETYSYKGWLNSDNFFKRCFGIVGYQLVGSLLINLAIFGVILALFIVFGIIGGLIRLAS